MSKKTIDVRTDYTTKRSKWIEIATDKDEKATMKLIELCISDKPVSLDDIKNLRDKGADLNAEFVQDYVETLDYSERTGFLDLHHRTHTPLIVEVLKSGYFLHASAKSARVNTAKALAEAGADINKKNDESSLGSLSQDKCSAFAWVIKEYDAKDVKDFAKYNADPNGTVTKKVYSGTKTLDFESNNWIKNYRYEEVPLIVLAIETLPKDFEKIKALAEIGAEVDIKKIWCWNFLNKEEKNEIIQIAEEYKKTHTTQTEKQEIKSKQTLSEEFAAKKTTNEAKDKKSKIEYEVDDLKTAYTLSYVVKADQQTDNHAYKIKKTNEKHKDISVNLMDKTR